MGHSSQSDAAAVLVRLRDQVMERIRLANELTERETLAIGDALSAIVSEAKASADDTRTALHDLSEGGIGGLMHRQETLLGEFVSTITAQVSAQSRAANDATQQIYRIAALGKQIDQITLDAKLLSLNANIEASRLGDAGKTFQVIAQEMKDFSGLVKEANATVQDLAESLLAILPVISRISDEMSRSSSEFQEKAGQQVRDISAASTSMRDVVSRTIATGEARLQRVLRHSQDALSHLQFQDPMAQRLLSCERVINDNLRAFGDVGSAAASGAATAAPLPSDEGESAEFESGEVMMF